MSALPSDTAPASPFEQRRRRLAAALAQRGGGVAIVPTAPERFRNGDNPYPYRHDSHFHYLTGFDEPGAWLLLEAGGRSTLICRERHPEREIWDGARLGPEAAPRVLGVDEAHPLDALDRVVGEKLANQSIVWLPFGLHDGLGARIEGWLAALRLRDREGIQAPSTQRDLSPLLGEMRLVKDDDELATMRRAAHISAEAHARAMRFCAAHFRAAPQQGLAEYAIEAELLHEFRRRGAQAPAYQSIVAAGRNACVLHHCAGATELRAGELCLIDAGCELDGYAADITRTFPANGRWSGEQRAVYEIVLAAQQAAADCSRPGARRSDAHWAAVRVLAQGMLDLGLLARDTHGDVDAVMDTAAYRRYYMHGTGHWLGRDVHDVGEYMSLAEPPVEQRDPQGGTVVRPPSRRLEPGMVLTLEPGLYVRPGPDAPERFWNIGIRIEDDAVITASGCELISRAVPVAPQEIEALMRG